MTAAGPAGNTPPLVDPRSADSDHPHVGQHIWTREQKRYGWARCIAASAVQRALGQ